MRRPSWGRRHRSRPQGRQREAVGCDKCGCTHECASGRVILGAHCHLLCGGEPGKERSHCLLALPSWGNCDSAGHMALERTGCPLPWGGGGGSWSRHRSLRGICFWRKAFFLVVHQRTYLGWSTNHVTEIAQNSVTGITSNGHECTVFSFPFARGEQKYIPQ